MSNLHANDPTRLLADLDFVRSLAKRLCADEHAAEDVAQDTMLTALEKPPSHNLNALGWLATVTRNFAHRHRRSERRLKAREAATASAEHAPSTEEVVAREQLRNQVVRAVLDLPTPYRTVVLLRHFRGFDVTACAKELGIPASTVRTQLGRATERLRRRLDSAHAGNRKQWVALLLPFTVPTPTDATTFAVASTFASNPKVAPTAIASLLLVAIVAWTQLASPATPPIPAGNTSAETSRNYASTAAPSSNASAAPQPGDAIARTAAASGNPSTWHVTGFASTSDKRAVAGCRVHLWANIGERAHPYAHIALGDVRTGIDGCFRASLEALQRLSSPALARVRVIANFDADGYEPQTAEQQLQRILSDHDKVDLHARLVKAHMVKGRVTRDDGTPVTGATVVLATDRGSRVTWTEPDGSFAIEPKQPDERSDYLILAHHPRIGQSLPLVRRYLEGREDRVHDLVLDRPGQRIVGRVHFADGQPVADISVAVYPEEKTAPTAIRGFAIRNYHSMFGVGNGTRCEQCTDRQGRFELCNAMPGSYTISVGNQTEVELVVEPGREVTNVEIEYAETPEAAQLEVRIEDEHGTWLPEALYGTHCWSGAEAATAKMRFEAEGATRELLATASRYDGLFMGTDQFLDAVTDTFTVIDCCFHDAGPIYAGCTLAKGQHRAAVRIVLKPRADTGSLQINVVDATGTKVDPVWFKLCRGTTRPAVPITLPDKQQPWALLPSRIPGAWHLVPKNGRIYDLPAGPLTVELLPAPEWVSPQAARSAYAISMHEVHVPNRATTTLEALASHGVPLVIELRFPPPGERERLRLQSKGIWIGQQSAGTLTSKLLILQPMDESAAQNIKAGTFRMRSPMAFAPGTYQLLYRPDSVLERFEPTGDSLSGSWRNIKRDYREVRQTIEIAHGMGTVILKPDAK